MWPIRNIVSDWCFERRDWNDLIPRVVKYSAIVDNSDLHESYDAMCNLRGDVTCSIMDGDLEGSYENLKILEDFLTLNDLM